MSLLASGDSPGMNEVTQAKAMLRDFGTRADDELLAEIEGVKASVLAGVRKATPWAALGAGVLGLFAVRGLRSVGKTSGRTDGAAKTGISWARSAIDLARMVLPVLVPLLMRRSRHDA